MFTITKEMSIHAAHALSDCPEGHPCKNMHGHTYTIRVTVQAKMLNYLGMVVDFNVLKDVVKRFDHANLNDLFPPYVATTSENFAEYLWGLFQTEINSKGSSVHVKEVTVCESETSSATFSVPNPYVEG